MRLLYTLLLAALLLASTALTAKTIIPFTDVGAMLDASAVSASGRIIGHFERTEGNTTFYGYQLQVDEAVKGTDHDEILEIVFGWQTVDATGEISMEPVERFLTVGDTYTVFLREGFGGYVLVTGDYGLYQLLPDDQGASFYVPAEAGHAFIMEHPSGEAIQSRRVYSPGKFIARLQARLSDPTLLVELGATDLAPERFQQFAAMIPAHCNPFTTDFSGSRPERAVRWANQTITIFVSSNNPSVGSTNAHALTQAMITSINNEYPGLNLVYGGVTAIGGNMCLSDALAAGGGTSITISFLINTSPCNQTGLTGCSGTLGRGGPSISSAENTSLTGETYYTITTGGVVIDPGAGCVGETGYIRLLEHEVTHALGFGHISGTGTANMNPQCCIAITQLDRDCLNFTYPTAAMPVELVNFVATPREGEVVLEWETASEQNSDFFGVERSSDGRSYTTLTQKQAAGDASDARNYSTVDRQPLSGTSYYRLAQVDIDGTVTYSEALAVDLATKGSLSLTPNPSRAGDELLLRGLGAGQQQIRLLDVSGREVYSASAKPVGGQFILALPTHLTQGMYYVQINDGVALRSEVLRIR